MVSFFNQQVDAFHSAHPGLSTTLKERERLAKLFVDHEPTKFSWQSADYARVAQSDRYEVVDRFVSAIF